MRLACALHALSVRGPVDLRARGMALAIALHLGLFAVLMVARDAQPRVPPTRSIAVIDVAAPAGPATPRKPAQPQPVEPTPPQPVMVPPPVVPLPLPSPMATAMLEEASAQAAGGACDLTAPVQEALRTSAVVEAVLPNIPRPSRSVANALMIWDADWVAFVDTPDLSARDTIRDAIAGVVAVASEDCRMQPQGGPRLLILPLGETQTIVLALGSGQWRWQDLLDTARPDGWVMASPEPEDVRVVEVPRPSPT